MKFFSRTTAKKPAVPLAAPRRKILVAACALFTIVVPLAIVAAIIVPHLDGGDANATPNSVRDTLPPTTSTTTPVSALPALAASPSAAVSNSAK